MISGGTEYSIRGGVVSGDILSAALGSEVVDDEEHVLGTECHDLEGVPGGGPGARQVPPVHTGAKVLLMQGRQFALEGARFADQVQPEIGTAQHGPICCRKQWETDRFWRKFQEP